MWAMFAVNRRVSVAALSSFLIASSIASAQSGSSLGIYLLKGTSTNYQPQTFPVRLYKRVDSTHVVPVRDLVDAKSGLYGVQVTPNGDLVVLYPSVIPTTISVVYADDPSKAYLTKFNPEAQSVLNNSVSLVATGAMRYAGVYPIITSQPDQPRTLLHREVEINPGPLQGSPAMLEASPSAFRELRFAGLEGGPANKFGLMGRLEGGSLWIDGRKVASLPPSNHLASVGIDVSILGANDSLVLFCISETLEALATKSSRGIYVLDRQAGVLKEINQPGNISTSRLVGPPKILPGLSFFESAAYV